MSIPQSGGGTVESFGQLAEYMEAGCKPPEAWRIGTEHEKFGWLTDSRAPLPYAGERSISAIFAASSGRTPEAFLRFASISFSPKVSPQTKFKRPWPNVPSPLS